MFISKDCKNVVFMDLVKDEEYSILLNSADVLIVNELPSVFNMSLPSKVQNYLLTDKDIVVACSKNSATYSLAVSQNLIHVEPGNPQELFNVFLRLNQGGVYEKRSPQRNLKLREKRIKWALAND